MHALCNTRKSEAYEGYDAGLFRHTHLYMIRLFLQIEAHIQHQIRLSEPSIMCMYMTSTSGHAHHQELWNIYMAALSNICDCRVSPIRYASASPRIGTWLPHKAYHIHHQELWNIYMAALSNICDCRMSPIRYASISGRIYVDKTTRLYVYRTGRWGLLYTPPRALEDRHDSPLE